MGKRFDELMQGPSAYCLGEAETLHLLAQATCVVFINGRRYRCTPREWFAWHFSQWIEKPLYHWLRFWLFLTDYSDLLTDAIFGYPDSTWRLLDDD